MKKIMFNDSVGLTESVLSGRKTMTRRIVPQSTIDKYALLEDPTIIDDARYNVGEVVAIAQAYKDISCGALYDDLKEIVSNRKPETLAGWANKMFVRADLIPRHIRIADMCAERLQDISDEDCLKEGVETMESYAIRADGKNKTLNYYRLAYRCKSGRVLTLSGSTPREVYSTLIDRISGKGTWESNPWVFVYDFELID